MADHSRESTLQIIRVENLSKLYNRMDVPALKDLSFSVSKGEFFGLLGPNGAGKTTLISILCGLVSPSEGRVIVDEIDTGRHPARIRGAIGLVPQDIALYDQLTVRENLSYFGRILGLRGKELRDRISDCLALSGLEKSADLRVSTLSGGMKRRANLVIGILHEPGILILDEPTVGIDPQSRNLVFETLERLNQSDVTIVYTTHYIGEAERLCTRVAVMDKGRIIADNRPRLLIEENPGCATLEDLFLRLTGKHLRD